MKILLLTVLVLYICSAQSAAKNANSELDEDLENENSVGSVRRGIFPADQGTFQILGKYLGAAIGGAIAAFIGYNIGGFIGRALFNWIGDGFIYKIIDFIKKIFGTV